MVRFLYLGDPGDVDVVLLPDVLRLAHKYDIPRLIKWCCVRMINTLARDTALPYVRVLRDLDVGAVVLPSRDDLCGFAPEDDDSTSRGSQQRPSPPTSPSSPIGHTFITVSRTIASKPEWLLAVLRDL